MFGHRDLAKMLMESSDKKASKISRIFFKLLSFYKSKKTFQK
jgi:hypothetical protein